MGTKELTFGNLDFFAKFITVNKDRPTELYVYNVDVEEVRCAIVTPRDNWSGQGLMGADISFGYLNKLPMRQKDIAQERKQLQMKSIFGGITGSAKRIPTSEGLSDEDEKEAA